MSAGSLLPDYRRLPEFVRRYGWPAGLERFAQETGRASQVGPDTRMRQTGWRGLLSWRERSTAIVFDAGFGTTPIALSENFDRVCAVYPDSGMRDVARARLEYRGIRNVELCAAMPDLRFDAAVVSGVRSTQLTPAFLGALQARLHNRSGAYLAFESHQAGSLAELAQPPCYAALRCIRRHLGRVRPYWYLGTIANGSELRAAGSEQRRWSCRLRSAAALWRGAHFGVQACEAPSLVEDILAVLAKELGTGPLAMERYVLAHPAGATLIIRDIRTQTRMVVRTPFGAHATALARTNADSLKRLRGSGLAPILLLAHSVHDQPFFVESAVTGAPPPPFVGPAYEQVLDEAARFLIGYHAATIQPTELSPAAMAVFVEPIIDAGMKRLRGQHGDSALGDVRAFLLRAFRGRRLNLVATHGDFTCDNFVLSPAGRMAGVFDWDLAAPVGLPLMDLAYLFTTSWRRRFPGTPHGFTPGVLGRFNEHERRLIAKYCAALRIPWNLVQPLFLMSWLNHVGIRMASEESYVIDPYFWSDVLERIPEIIQSCEAAA